MHAVAAVLLVLWGIGASRPWLEREEKGEDCYRAAKAADTDADREFQLALFTVFKTQSSSHRLRCELCLGAAVVVSLLFGHEVVAEVRAFVASLP
jgi:hypothetical protein